MVGKMGKVGGKVWFYTGKCGKGEIYTKFCGGFTQGFADSFTQDFHILGILMGKWKIFCKDGCG